MHRLRRLVAAAAASTAVASPLLASPSTINFETVPSGTLITNQFPGVTFSIGAAAGPTSGTPFTSAYCAVPFTQRGLSANSSNCDGIHMAFDTLQPEVSFAWPQASATAGSQRLTATAYDDLGNTVDTVTQLSDGSLVCGAGAGPRFTLNSPAGEARIRRVLVLVRFTAGLPPPCQAELIDNVTYFPDPDATPPVIDLTAPIGPTCVCDTFTMTGSISEPDGDYSGDRLEYRRVDVETWTLAATASSPRSGVLYSLNVSAFPDGYYFFRITAENDFGLSSNQVVLVYIDRTAPGQDVRVPPNGGVIGRNACIIGTIGDAAFSCPGSYAIGYRQAGGGGAFTPIPNNFSWPSTLATWNTAAVSDGLYELRVETSDTCGNTSQTTRIVEVDNTPPIADIRTPEACSNVPFGNVQIIGTAFDANITRWSVQYAGPSGQWVQIASGSANVVNGLLATWDTSHLERCAYALRVLVYDASVLDCGTGFQSEDVVTVDLGAPLEIGDVNCDGLVNFDDIDPFVICLINGGCDCP